jgi:hypothetical protein
MCYILLGRCEFIALEPRRRLQGGVAHTSLVLKSSCSCFFRCQWSKITLHLQCEVTSNRTKSLRSKYDASILSSLREEEDFGYKMSVNEPGGMQMIVKSTSRYRNENW